MEILVENPFLDSVRPYLEPVVEFAKTNELIFVGILAATSCSLIFLFFLTICKCCCGRKSEVGKATEVMQQIFKSMKCFSSFLVLLQSHKVICQSSICTNTNNNGNRDYPFNQFPKSMCCLPLLGHLSTKEVGMPGE